MSRIQEADFKPDLYTRLGIPQSATAVEIARAYKRRAFETHPDRNNGSPEATAEFVAVGRAYEVLKDPHARREYDLELYRRGMKGPAYHDKVSPYPYNDLFREDPSSGFGFGPRRDEKLYNHFKDRTEDLYRTYHYTPEDLARYLAAHERMSRGMYQKGDLGTVFNFHAGTAGRGSPPKLRKEGNESLSLPGSDGDQKLIGWTNG